MERNYFDCIVIGAGSGGLNITQFLHRVGLRVLLVDKDESSIGGDCLNYGCVPSKALIHASRLVQSGKDAERFGILYSGEVDIVRVMDYVRERQEVIRAHENAEYFRKLGIKVAIGAAKFTGEKEVTVDGTAYRAKRIVIATGSRPRTLEVPGSEHVPIYTNETIFGAEVFPKSLLVVGGGPIGFEIGQSFSRLGSEVTILNRDNMWLPKEHRSVVAPLMDTMEREGVRFLPYALLKEVHKDGTAIIETKEGTQEVSCDAIFVSIGRVLNHDSLDVAAAGIKEDEHGKLIVDPYLRTTNKHVYVVGDAAGQHQFTHAAEVHASLILRNFFKPRFLWRRLDTDTMAWVTYTDPEIATFGLSEVILAERRIAFRNIEQSFEHSDRAITDARTEGLLRLFVSPSGRILGGTMVGKDAGELVSELILAQTHSLSVGQLFARVYPYPTASRINRLAAGQFLSEKLTERTKWLLRFLY